MNNTIPSLPNAYLQWLPENKADEQLLFEVKAFVNFTGLIPAGFAVWLLNDPVMWADFCSTGYFSVPDVYTAIYPAAKADTSNYPASYHRFSNYADGEDALDFQLQMGYGWQDDSYSKLNELTDKLEADFDGSGLVPLILLFHYARTIDWLMRQNYYSESEKVAPFIIELSERRTAFFNRLKQGFNI